MTPLESLRALAELCEAADGPGLARIASEANRLILEFRLSPEAVLAAIPLATRARLLTGFKREFSIEEVVNVLSYAPPAYVVKVIAAFPGKKCTIDANRLCKAINAGEFPLP